MGSVRRFYRQVLAVFIGASSIAVPIAVTQFGGGTPASASTYDTITYTQTSGAKGTYLQFQSADGSTVVKQSITSGGGGCSNPTVNSTTPLLSFSANEYPNGYTNAPAAPGTATVGAYQGRTGVCFTPQAWSIENNEGLDFALGSYPKYAAGRVFNRTQLVIQRWADKTGSPTLTVQLVEWLNEGSGEVQVGQQDCLMGVAGTQLTVDTNITSGNGSCVADTGYPNDPSRTGFDTIEVRELLAGGSISVVGPTSTFTLENQICGGDKPITATSTDGIGTTGNVTATLTLTGSNTQCKSYSGFTANAVNADGSQSVEFDSMSIQGVPFTVSVTWAEFDPACAPFDNGTGMPVCPPTEFELNGQTVFSPETFCSAASSTDPLCVTSRSYSYLPDPTPGDDDPATEANADVTQIKETWSGLADWIGKS